MGTLNKNQENTLTEPRFNKNIENTLMKWEDFQSSDLSLV